MGIKYSFIDSTIYGTDDINDITRSLTGAGVAPFVSKDSYSVTDLNVLTSALVGSGVQLDGCKCTVYNAGTADMMVTVAQGIIFFESGVRLEVDEQGYTIAVPPNTTGYIYAHYSPSLQKADIVFDTELPTDGEYVLLAELSLDGILSDKRAFARSKIATLGKNNTFKCNFTPIETEILGETAGLMSYVIAEVKGVEVSKFNYVIVRASGTINLYNLTAKAGVIGVHPGWSSPSTGGNYISSYGNSNCYIRTVDERLCIVVQTDNEGLASKYDPATYTAEFI